MVKIDQSGNFSDSEKQKLLEAVENLTEAINKTTNDDHEDPDSEAGENESVNRLELELSQTSKKLDNTQAEIRKLHDQLGKIYKIYGAASPAALHPGTNEANRQK